MHGSFQLKKPLMYELILSVSKNMWHTTIEALQLKSDRKCMLGVNLKNININSPMNSKLIY
jgi:hypothetical protein